MCCQPQTTIIGRSDTSNGRKSSMIKYSRNCSTGVIVTLVVTVGEIVELGTTAVLVTTIRV